MQQAHSPKPLSFGRKKTKCPNTCGAVLGKGMDFLLLQTSCCSCRAVQREPPHGPARLRPGVSGTHSCTLLSGHSRLPLVFLLGKGALRTKPMISCKCSCAGIVLCRRHFLWGRRCAGGTGGTQAPTWDKRDIPSQTACGTCPSSPAWHPLALLRSPTVQPEACSGLPPLFVAPAKPGAPGFKP